MIYKKVCLSVNSDTALIVSALALLTAFIRWSNSRSDSPERCQIGSCGSFHRCCLHFLPQHQVDSKHLGTPDGRNGQGEIDLSEMHQDYSSLSKLDADFPPLISRIVVVSHLLTVFNSSANLYIYILKHHNLKSLLSITYRCRSVDDNLTEVRRACETSVSVPMILITRVDSGENQDHVTRRVSEHFI